jgi:hypothetical protein
MAHSGSDFDWRWRRTRPLKRHLSHDDERPSTGSWAYRSVRKKKYGTNLVGRAKKKGDDTAHGIKTGFGRTGTGYLPSLGLGGLTGILARATNLGGNETLLRVKSEEMTTAHRYHGGSRTDADLLGRRSTPLEGDRIRLLRGHIMPRLYLHIRT